MRTLIALAFAACLALAPRAHAQSTERPLDWGEIFLYQAENLDAVMPDELALSGYIDRLEAAATALVARTEPRTAASGLFFVAIKPGGKARVWVITQRLSFTPSLSDALETAMSAQTPPPSPGDFLFAIAFGAWGAPAYNADGPPPLPASWEAQIPREGVMLNNAFIDRVWPD